MSQSPIQQPMPPWPDLAAYARKVSLPGSELSLHVYAAGNDQYPPVLLIHGLGDEADSWRHLFPLLADQWRVIAADLPGFGRSDKPDRPYSMPFFQGALTELLDVLQIPQVTLVGHSFGGAIAQAITLDHPQRIDRLVLIGGSLVTKAQKISASILLFLIPGVGEWLYNRLRKNSQAAYRTLEPYYAALEQMPEAERSFLYERVNQRVWDDGQRGAFLSALRSMVRWLPGQQASLPSRLAASPVPTTVLWGEADQINPVDNGRALVAVQPSARLVVVPGAGHNLHQEQPGVVRDAIVGKLDVHESS